MRKKEKVIVFKFEYETNDMSWTLRVAAWSKEDALGYIYKMVKTPIKIKTVSMESTIDAITSQVINDIMASVAFKTNEFEPEQAKPTIETQATVTQVTEQEEQSEIPKRPGRPKKTMDKK